MIRIRRKTAVAAFVLVALIGASFAAAAAMSEQCRFAYSFCKPRYYACLASGTSQIECHLELDACLLRNGCSSNELP
ncbi:hypothetical protein [Marilutibacter maris]|uniref:hypothetical protein n=1 Tax=Marilutibacter maris TaxID=1605891 RepID=UPI000DA9596D|nr:hypothetical protein [Lysobacter maris]